LRGREIQVQANNSGGVVYTEQVIYNPDGVRTASLLTQGSTTTTGRYLIDPQSLSGFAQVLEQLDGSGLLVATYVHGLTPISEYTNGQASYYLSDAHSGVRQLLTTASAVAASYLYDAFGNLSSSVGSVTNPLLYRGEWFDSTTGQYYLRRRWYIASVGRFDAVDPLGLAGGDTDLYRYASGNPIKYDDLSGLQFALAEVIDVAGIAATNDGMRTPGIVYVVTWGVRSTTAIRIISWLLLSGIAVTTAAISTLAFIAPAIQPVPQPDTAPPDTETECTGCPPKYLYADLDGLGRATGANAQFSAPQIRIGERADFAQNGPWWWNGTNLPTPRDAEVSDVWDKGHLVASVLGGAGGTQWKNMVPLYRSVNYPTMYWDVENRAQAAALGGGCVQYWVAPEYTGNHYFPDCVGIMIFVDGACIGAWDLPNEVQTP
jgi:RHS repeat-associated protein